ncbi:hypothetical protein [Gracilibacillus lacisalsi]|uniref:hypothetical protein n=1 Tax=Gracilibacillus lacisalsi TaxID=393087 RepID=UPI000369E78D|nr:hypothetical protein [Gracilibacillus lacisalsi]
MEKLEQRVVQLEKEHEHLKRAIRSLQAELDITIKKTLDSRQQQSAPDLTKMTYLQEVNEQMFQQNVRLRNLIEKCIERSSVPTQENYYKALREDK